jgi:hypothetical protein
MTVLGPQSSVLRISFEAVPEDCGLGTADGECSNE